MQNASLISIPPLPEALVNCLTYMYKDNFNYGAMVKKISLDIGISQQILNAANSQYFSQGAPPISNLKHAVVRLGGKNILKILTESYYKNLFKNTEIDFFTLKRFNRHSNFVSHLALSLAEHLNIENTSDLLIGSLFHDVGHIARCHCQTEIMKKVIQKCKEKNTDFYTSEILEQVPTHNTFGSQIAQEWQLNSRVCYLISHHHSHPDENFLDNTDSDLQRELAILTFSDVIAHRMSYGYNNYERETKVNQQFLDRIGITSELATKKAKEAFFAVSGLC